MNPMLPFALALLSLSACGDPKDPEDTEEGDTDTDTDTDTDGDTDSDADTDSDTDPLVFVLTSTAFGDGAPIPVLYSCDGDNISPPLAWTGAPGDTVAFAITMLDPDAEDCPHWGLFNLPAGQAGLEEGVSPGGQIPTGAWQTLNYEGDAQYSGPCPPAADDPHNYMFTIYALSAEVPDPGTPTALEDGIAAVGASSITRTKLFGTFDH